MEEMEKTENGIKFADNNQYKYFQDFAFWQTVDSSVIWKVKSITDKAFILTAKGYGEKDAYGNGAIFLWKKDLTEKEIEILETCFRF